jgi:hypothetical protein
LRQWLEHWHDVSSAMFLKRYLGELRGTELLPDDPAHVGILLQTYFIERGCRDLLQHLQHPGPDLGVALTTLLEMLKLTAETMHPLAQPAQRLTSKE